MMLPAIIILLIIAILIGVSLLLGQAAILDKQGSIQAKQRVILDAIKEAKHE